MIDPGRGTDVQALQAQIQQWRQEERLDMAAHHAENKNEMEALRREMLALSSAVKTAFPGGDFDGHRRYHELLIAREEQRQQIRREVITHLLKGAPGQCCWACSGCSSSMPRTISNEHDPGLAPQVSPTLERALGAAGRTAIRHRGLHESVADRQTAVDRDRRGPFLPLRGNRPRYLPAEADQ